MRSGSGRRTEAEILILDGREVALSSPDKLLFPKAKFVVGKRAFERAVHPHPRDRASFIPELQPLLEQSGRLELVENAHSFALGKSLRFSFPSSTRSTAWM